VFSHELLMSFLMSYIVILMSLQTIYCINYGGNGAIEGPLGKCLRDHGSPRYLSAALLRGRQY
jgi:hypothetical protein